ncbi:hypothetical protein [Lysinibacillus boronitolerans]|uniref:hypothetical protein n=1 Tax=Lysinibacillus boronitolerans TaxID=309788 RepID=UPI0002FCF01D|nr:hypothetical protein [Lysinibacillus boronitolerans]
MGENLVIGILGSIIATFLVGGAIYKFIIKNRGIIQKEGNNQVALQKSKNNSINIGVEPKQNEKQDNSN